MLQDEIYSLYGRMSPQRPQLRLCNATQTSIVLEWDPIELATATLRSLTLYRNNAKAGNIPNPKKFTSTKISGLAVGEEYTFHLVLRTSAGTYSSDRVTVRTHTMTDLSGITVCAGVLPSDAREGLEAALQRIGARPLQDAVRIDTTHFVCTEGRGPAWDKAVEMNIPVVYPEWIEACEREGRIVAARNYYLSVDVAKIRQSLPQRTPIVSTTPATPTSPRRQSASFARTVATAVSERSPEAKTPSVETLPETVEEVSQAPIGANETSEASENEMTGAKDVETGTSSHVQVDGNSSDSEGKEKVIETSPGDSDVAPTPAVVQKTGSEENFESVQL